MNHSKIQKTGAAVGVLAITLSFLPFLGGGQRFVSADSKPSIKEVRGRQVDEIKLPIKYEKYAGKSVRIRLYTTNTFTGEEMVTHHNRELDKDGRVTLRVKGLDPGVIYSFKTRIKKQSGGDYTSKSDDREGSTKLIGQK